MRKVGRMGQEGSFCTIKSEHRHCLARLAQADRKRTILAQREDTDKGELAEQDSVFGRVFTASVYFFQNCHHGRC